MMFEEIRHIRMTGENMKNISVEKQDLLAKNITSLNVLELIKLHQRVQRNKSIENNR